MIRQNQNNNSQVVKMAKKNVQNTKEGLAEETTTQKRYKPYVFVSLKRDKKCVRPLIHAYGTNPDEVREAAVEAYERVCNELIQEGYTVA
jgi:hypothetical protein